MRRITITLAAHGHFEAMLAQGYGHFQSSDCQIALHSVTDHCRQSIRSIDERGGAADHASRMQIQDHDQIQPPFMRPDIADINHRKAIFGLTFRQRSYGSTSLCNVELMIAVHCHPLAGRHPSGAREACIYGL